MLADTDLQVKTSNLVDLSDVTTYGLQRALKHSENIT